MIALPSPAHSNNSIGQRAQPRRFYLAACPVELGIEFFVQRFGAERPPDALKHASWASHNSTDQQMGFFFFQHLSQLPPLNGQNG